MLESRKRTRQRLKNCSRVEYETLINAANLSPVQKAVLDMFIVERLSIVSIAFRLSYCESLVRLRLAEAYDKLARV